LGHLGVIESFDHFTLANMSGPTGLFRSVGGLDESFRGYGMEDYEFGYRILSAGITVRFDPTAIAWHDFSVAEETLILRQRTTAHNTVLLARRHPDTLPTLFPGTDRGFACRLLAKAHLRSPRYLLGVCKISTWLGLDARILPRRVRRIFRHIAYNTSFAVGIAETAPELLPMVLAGSASHLPELRAE